MFDVVAGTRMVANDRRRQSGFARRSRWSFPLAALLASLAVACRSEPPLAIPPAPESAPTFILDITTGATSYRREATVTIVIRNKSNRVVFSDFCPRYIDRWNGDAWERVARQPDPKRAICLIDGEEPMQPGDDRTAQFTLPPSVSSGQFRYEFPRLWNSDGVLPLNERVSSIFSVESF